MKNNVHAYNLKHINYITAILLAFTGVWIISCKNDGAAPKTEAATGDLAGYELVEIPGTAIKHAVRKDANGQVTGEGYVLNGKKTGEWVEYTPDGEISLIDNYVEGAKQGLSLKFATRGQVEQRSRYHQGLLHGPYVQYKFGKVIEERPYTMGKLDGIVRTFEDRTWKLKQEVQYKDGKQDGFFRYYDENGNVTLEYQYKNGEKVSGGIVEKK